MTNVTIIKKQNLITQIICDGHTNFGVSGEDIVCSALSSIVQTAALGVLAVAGVNAEIERNEKRGYLSLKLPCNVPEGQMHDAQVILQTMLLGVQDLHEGYSDFVEIEIK